MTLDSYRNFVAIVDCGSISAASKQLLIAQPSLSNQLKNIEKVNSDVVMQLYQQKDPEVLKMIQKYAEYLAISVNNIIMIQAPEMVIFNSPITKKIPAIIEFIKDYLKNRYAKEVKIMNSPIQWNPVIYGAIAFSIQQFLNIEQLKLMNGDAVMV